MPRHYLDHASTSPLRPEARAAIAAWLDGPAGDPGRVHAEGARARAAVEEGRELVAASLGVRPRQVVFTSGGTESVHAAIWGALWERPGSAVVASAVEHSCVRQAAARLAPLVEVPVGRSGRIDLEALADALDSAGPRVGLVTCQWGNHEVGTLQPLAEVVRLARRAGALVHCDAACAYGQVAVELGGTALGDLGEDGPDLLSVSAHKMGGPTGVGALVVRRGVRVEPLLVGGQQERGRRAGMEPVAGIVGFGAAAGAWMASSDPDGTAARALTDALARLATAQPGVGVVGDPVDRLPHLVCLGVDGVEAEPVLLGLDRAGIAAHSGSACASEGLEPSPVLAAMGVDPSHSLRLSVGWSSGPDDVAAFGAAFGPVVADLRALGAAPTQR